jgi:hypothetical protein
VIRRYSLSVALVLAGALALAPGARADFGILPGSFSTTALNQDGTLDTQAASHPGSYTVSFALNTEEAGHSDGGELRDVLVDLPPGLIGDPQAVPSCSRQDFEGIVPRCSGSTQVGIVHATIGGVTQAVGPLFNVKPPPGAAAQLGFSVISHNALESASVHTEAGYGIGVDTSAIPIELTAVSETVWGTPADPSHDPERFCQGAEGGFVEGCSSEAASLPFLTLPADCSAPLQTSVEVDSKLAPGLFKSATAASLDAGGNPAALTGCQSVPFAPSVTAVPSTGAAESSTGLGFELKLPDEGLLDPNGVVETEPEKTEVALPTGITANPAAAAGLAGCSEQQYREATGEPGQGCPEASKLGTLVARSPLLEEAIEGSVYLATPNQNRFHSLLALYIVAKAKERGVLVKQAGKVEADPTTGQLTTTFDELPPLPYSSFEFDLREGPRAPLITPQACGEYTTVARLYPFSEPGSAAERTAPFKITSGANGGGCASGEGGLPNHPNFEAGVTAPIAGAYSPFVFTVARSDGEQRFSSISGALPAGLLGKLKGVPYCPESGIATATSRGQEGGGALEQAAPSCPSVSQVGVVNVSAGAGPSPYHVQGKVYLAGPYKGAPLSLEIITPAVAGPFDLGSVAVRTALNVDPFTAQISAVSDALPAILHGIPLDVRTISLQMNKPEFTLNPTDCSSKTVTGSVTSLVGQGASLSNPFAVGGCKGLEFKPKLSLSLKGATRRTGHPALKAVVTYPKGSGYANIARAQVGLPHSEFLDQGNLNKTCTKPVLVAGNCPKSSVYGKVKAWTPLLEKPLTGNVYLVGGFGYKLPALVAELNGQVRILLKGKVDTTKQHGIRNTFEAVPDAPVEKFVLEMRGGKKYGLIENSENLCAKAQKVSALFTAQNGKTLHLTPKIANGCKGKGKKHSKRT